MEFILGLILSAEFNGRPLLYLYFLSQHGTGKETWKSSNSAHDIKSLGLQGRKNLLLCVFIPKLKNCKDVVTFHMMRNLFIITIFLD